MIKFNKNNKFINRLSLLLISFLIIVIGISMVVCASSVNTEDSHTENAISITEPTEYTETITSTTPTTSVTTTTTTTQTTTLTTTSITTTTETTTTIIVIEEVPEEVEEYYETETEIIEEPIIQEEVTDYVENDSSDMTYAGNFTAKWYDNRGLGYSEYSNLYGSSGRTLISGYSVASNYFPSGTLLYIKGGCHNGIYRVDDTGAMSNDVIDFYYQYRSDIPSNFKRDGVYSIEVYIIN